MNKKFINYCIKIHDSLRENSNSYSPLYLSTKTGMILENKECLPLMNTPSGGGVSITPIDCQCSVSSLKIDMLNSEYVISQWLYERLNSNESMVHGEMVDVYAITSENELIMIYKGIVRDITNDEFESKYSLEISDFQERLKASIFDREFSDYSSESVDDINRFRMPTGFSIVKATEDSKEIKIVKYTGHVIDLIKGIFQIAFSTPELEVQAHYLSNKWQDFVDLKSFNEIKEILNSSMYNFYFEWREPIDDPFDFLIENIYKTCAIFPYVDQIGRLGLKLHRQPPVGTGNITLSEDNIISVDAKRITDENVINQLIVEYDYNFIEEKSKVKRYFTNKDSFNKFKMLLPNKPQEYEVLGINKLSDTDKSTFSGNITDSMFSRYGFPNVEIKVTIPLEIAAKYRIGEYLFIIHKTLVAWQGKNQGTPGLKHEIEESDPLKGFAYLKLGHEWGGFLDGNNLGTSIDGTIIITTTDREIQSRIFNGNENGFKSCLNNHSLIDNWLKHEGV